MFYCSCCGTEVTSPYFYEGGVYGYTCIKKVKPDTKRNKPKSKAVKVELLKIVFEDENSARGKAYIIVNGEKSIVTAYRGYNEDMTGFTDGIEIGNYSLFNGEWYTLI